MSIFDIYISKVIFLHFSVIFLTPSTIFIVHLYDAGSNPSEVMMVVGAKIPQNLQYRFEESSVEQSIDFVLPPPSLWCLLLGVSETLSW